MKMKEKSYPCWTQSYINLPASVYKILIVLILSMCQRAQAQNFFLKYRFVSRIGVNYMYTPVISACD